MRKRRNICDLRLLEKRASGEEKMSENRTSKSWLPDDPNPSCGYGPLSTDPAKEPFLSACVIHDHEFGLRDKDEQPKSLWQVDWEFYKNMRLVAGRDVLLNIRAAGYFVIAKLLGPFFW